MSKPRIKVYHTVLWAIDVLAESPADAAQQALEIQRDSTSLATVFDVRLPGTKLYVRVDLGYDERLRD